MFDKLDPRLFDLSEPFSVIFARLKSETRATKNAEDKIMSH